MEKILIDIDNNVPGAIINSVIEYIIPRCARFGNKKDVLTLFIINKYFNKVVKSKKCYIETLCDHLVCKKHSPNFAKMKIIHTRIEKARHLLYSPPYKSQGWIHFDSKNQADIAKPFVARHFTIKGRCCSGSGLKIVYNYSDI